MRSLFTKIFVSFWLTVVLVGVTLYLTNLSRRRYEAKLLEVSLELNDEQWHARAAKTLPGAAERAAAAYERGGRRELELVLSRTTASTQARAYFFNGQGEPLLNYPDLPGQVRESARDLQARPATEVAATRASSGNRYILALWNPSLTQTVISFRPGSPARAALGEGEFSASDPSPWIFLLAVLIIGGGVCFWLTRHITRPLMVLRSAAGAIAHGELDARAGPNLAKRRDELGDLARDFDRMAGRIEGLIDAQRRLLADVSHEFRSPLARMRVALDLARRGQPGEAEEYHDRMKRECARLDHLIAQLLTLSRAESGAGAVDFRVFDFTELVHQVAADATFEARTQLREAEVENAEPCLVRGAEEMLRAAVENVVRNGVRHTAPDTKVEISLTNSCGIVRLEVRDHGPGVPQDKLNDIFIPFRRVVGVAPDPVPYGIGLGLAIAERVVGLHGGEITASLPPGGGLLVRIVLPTEAR